AQVSVVVTEPYLSRDHSERMLAVMGASVTTERLADGRVRIALEPPDRLAPLDLHVPGDFSSAAFFLALGVLGKEPVLVEGVCINPTRTGLLDVLRRMGVHIHIEERRQVAGEEVGDLIAYPSHLHATDVVPEEIPALIDEVPVIAVLASRASGETRITG